MVKVRKDLSLFDLTNLVIGGIVGADIYIVSAITAGLIGPFSIFVWLVAGLLAIALALVFAYSSYYFPKVGGPFSYVSHSFDKFYGFLTGWSMWIAEVAALAIFPIIFVYYLSYLVDLSFPAQIAIQGLFVFSLTMINILGVKRAGRVNDVLTIMKLSPLLLLMIVGGYFFLTNTETFAANYQPLLPFGLEHLGLALVLIFWSYSGFEMGTLPASEVKNPRKNIPKAIVSGVFIITAFYLATNFIIFGAVPYTELAESNLPLVAAGTILMGSIGALIMIVGGLFSVSGSDEAGVLGTARLSYAMSIHGLFPKIFSKLHPKYKTPYMALIIQGVLAFAASLYYNITELITFAVFNLAFAYLLTSMSLLAVKREKQTKLFGKEVVAWVGIGISIFLLYYTSLFDKIVGAIVIGVGILLYVFFSPKEDIKHLKRMFYSEEAVLARRLEHRDKFLANFIRILHRTYKRIKNRRKGETEIYNVTQD